MVKCPLEKSCLKLRCDAATLVEWQAKHSNETYGASQLANRIASFKCRRERWKPLIRQ